MGKMPIKKGLILEYADCKAPPHPEQKKIGAPSNIPHPNRSFFLHGLFLHRQNRSPSGCSSLMRACEKVVRTAKPPHLGPKNFLNCLLRLTCKYRMVPEQSISGAWPCPIIHCTSSMQGAPLIAGGAGGANPLSHSPDPDHGR